MDPVLYTPYRLRRAGVSVLQPNPYRAQSSEWWIYRLNAKLDEQLPVLETLDAYYRGANDTFQLASTAARTSGIADLFRGINANLAKLVVDAPRHRMEVYGFRTGSPADDDRIWAVWQRNDMDAASDAAHKDALIMRGCPVIVEPDSDGQPVITPQDPRSCYVEHNAGDRRIVRAALKRWLDDAGRWSYTLYLPDRIERWRDRRTGSVEQFVTGLLGMTPLAYEARVVDGVWAMANPLGEVPVVMVPNQGRTRGTTEAEHEAVLPLLDLYNKTLLDLATTSEFGAFPQRYGIGVDEEDDPQPATDAAAAAAGTSQPLARIRAAVDSMIVTASPDAQFGQFAAADLANYVSALDAIRGNIGSITFTPFHLLLNMPTSTPATGEALKAAEVGLTAKVRSDHHREKGRAWRSVQRLVFRILDGVDQATAAERVIETVWRNPETLSEAQHVDALSKAEGLGIPQEALWELWPASPAEIKRWRAMATAQQQAATGQSVADPRYEQAASLIRSGFDPADTLAKLGLPAIEHTGLAPVTVQRPPSTVPSPATAPALPAGGGPDGGGPAFGR